MTRGWTNMKHQNTSLKKIYIKIINYNSLKPLEKHIAKKNNKMHKKLQQHVY